MDVECSVNESCRRTFDGGWSEFFAQKDLQELVQQALGHNRDLQAVVAATAQIQAQLGLRRADQWPTVNAVLSGSRTPASGGGITSSYTGGLLVTSYEVDLFDRVAQLSAQAQAQLAASQEAQAAARLSLVATVAQTWLNLLADADLLALAQTTLQTRQSSLELVQLRLDHGVGSELDLRSAQSLLESARINLAQAQRQRAVDEHALSVLLGQPATAEQLQRAGAGVLARVQWPELAPGLPADLLQRRPDLRQAERTLAANQANVAAARAALFPRITLTAGVGSASSALADLFQGGTWGWTLAPQLLVPIFDAGRNAAAIDAAKASQDQALAQYDKAIQTAFREVADALVSQRTLREQLQASQALAQTESQRSQLVTLRLQHGAASLLDDLDAQRSLLTAQQGVIQTRLALLQNQATLFKVLGGEVPLAQAAGAVAAVKP
jgi:multidrug efflux system outer membrane protein